MFESQVGWDIYRGVITHACKLKKTHACEKNEL